MCASTANALRNRTGGKASAKLCHGPRPLLAECPEDHNRMNAAGFGAASNSATATPTLSTNSQNNQVAPDTNTETPERFDASFHALPEIHIAPDGDGDALAPKPHLQQGQIGGLWGSGPSPGWRLDPSGNAGNPSEDC